MIAIAKQKMAAKRFLPSLLGIPEETDHIPLYARSMRSGQSVASGSIVTVRQGGGRRRSCEGCPGCVRPHQSCSPTPGCQACSSVTPETKHHSIRKWLEDVPIVKPLTEQKVAPSTTVKKEVNARVAKHGPSTKGRAPDIPRQAQVNKHSTNITKDESKVSENEKLQKNAGLQNCSEQIQEDESINNITSVGKQNIVGGDEEKLQNGDTAKSKSPPNVPDEVWNDILYKASLADSNIKEIRGKPISSPSAINANAIIDKEHLSLEEQNTKPEVAKQLMDAVIKELVDHRSLECKPSPPTRQDSLPPTTDGPTSMDYETDSLDRTMTRPSDEREGMRTPSDYGGMEIKTDTINGSTLPMDKELTMTNSLFNLKTGNTTISKFKSEIDDKKVNVDDHDYEVILLNPMKSKNNKFNLPDILSRVEGYSLVSEVYVNDAYSFGSSSSLQSNESSCSSLKGSRDKPKIKYTADEPGHLTIEVEDSPRNYERTYDSDSFEPDTLDRKPSKFKINSEGQFEYQLNRDCFADSLERPAQISLRTTGSFRSDSSLCWYDTSNLSDMVSCPLNRTFGSLREIFEAKNRYNRNGNTRSETLSPVGSTRSLDTECYSTMSWRRGKPKLLRPEAKQARRQRQPSPPEYAPPRPPKTIYSNELVATKNEKNNRDKSPKTLLTDSRPPLPPKNGQVRSTSQRVAQNQKSSHLISTTRGVLTSASDHSPISSDYEGYNAQDKNQGRQLEITLQNEIQRNFEAAQERNKHAIISKNTREKRNSLPLHKMHKVSKVPHRTEDSGYLSSDSSGSQGESLSETDDSLYDGASESGAESIATDSFFFGKSHKLSLDSGLCRGVRVPSVISDTDSNVSFVTVLPMDLDRTNNFVV